MVRVKGPTLNDLESLGERFTDVVLAAARQTLRSASREVTASRTPDDVGKIPTWWAKQVDDVLMPALAESFWHGVNIVHGGLARSATSLTAAADDDLGVELFPGESPGPIAPVGTSDVAASIPRVSTATAETQLLQRRNHLVGIGDELWQNARAELVAGVHNGESVAKLQDRVIGSLDVSSPRAATIARTEVNGAVNAGSISEMREIGLPAKKEWVATAGKRTRPSHSDADGQQVDLADKFTVGGYQLDCPHDPGAPIEEVVNCRCTLAYELGDDDVRELVNTSFTDAVSDYRVFTDPGEADTWGSSAVAKTGVEKYKNNLDTDMKMMNWRSMNYKKINEYLRKGHDPTILPHGATRHSFDTPADYALTTDDVIKAHTLKENVVVFRGVRGDTILSTVSAGDEFQDLGFVATSLIRDTAEAYSRHNSKSKKYANKKPVVVDIRVPQGTHAYYSRDVGAENFELTLDRGLTYKVLSIDDSGLVRKVVLEVVGL